MGHRRGRGRKDHVSYEVYIEDNRNCGDNIQEKEEREEVIVDNKGAKNDLDDEDAHNCQADTVEHEVDGLIEKGCPEIVREKRVQSDQRDEYLIF